MTTATLSRQLPRYSNLLTFDADAHHQFRATVGQLIWASLERPDAAVVFNILQHLMRQA